MHNVVKCPNLVIFQHYACLCVCVCMCVCVCDVKWVSPEALPVFINITVQFTHTCPNYTELGTQPPLQTKKRTEIAGKNIGEIRDSS